MISLCSAFVTGVRDRGMCEAHVAAVGGVGVEDTAQVAYGSPLPGVLMSWAH